MRCRCQRILQPWETGTSQDSFLPRILVFHTRPPITGKFFLEKNKPMHSIAHGRLTQKSQILFQLLNTEIDRKTHEHQSGGSFRKTHAGSFI